MHQQALKEVSSDKSVAVINANTTEDLKMAASDQGDLAGTSITVTPGSLQISTTIVIEKGSALADSSVANEVALAEDLEINQAGDGVIVRPSVPTELNKPLKLSLPLPAVLGARLAGTQYAVYYKYFDPQANKLLTGYKIVDEVNVKLIHDAVMQKDLVEFEGYFGIYWVVVLSRPVQPSEVPAPKVSEEPIVNNANTTVIASSGIVKESEIIKTQALPPLEWPKPILVFDDKLRIVKLTAESALQFNVRDCKSDFYETTTVIKGITIDIPAPGIASYSIQKTTAHKLVGRFRCYDTDNRATLSPWSDSVAIAAANPVSIVSIGSSAAAGLYGVGTVIPIDVTFTEEVFVEGTPTLALETGSTKRQALYGSGSGTKKLTFNYTVQAGDESSNLAFVGASSLTGGKIRDSRAIAASVNLPATSATLSRTALMIDAVAPSAPGSLAFPAAASGSTSLSLSWTAGTDSHLKQHNIKLCTTNDCSSSCSATSTSQTSPVTLNAAADGIYYGCVQAEDQVGNLSSWVSSSAITVATAAPVATIAGMPTDQSNLTTLNVSIGPAGISSYRYKIRQSSDTACTDITGYGSAISASSLISDSITSLPDGSLEICVIAQNAVGTWQAASAATAVSWTKDTVAPTATLSAVPSGTNNTTSLNATVAGTGVSHYKYKIRGSADAACSNASGYSSEFPVGTTIAASLGGFADGTLELCVIGRDIASNWQSPGSASSASWTKDSLSPAASSLSIASAAPYTNTLAVSLALSASSADEMYVTNVAGCGSGGSWETYVPSKSWTLGQSNATATVYAKFRDLAGNESSCISDTIVHDSQAPASFSLSINSGAISTTSTGVSLSLSASDGLPIEMYITNTLGCGSGGTWESFAGSRSWTLAQTGGTATVYVKYRDAAGNSSSCVSDTITHYAGAPTSAFISIESGSPTVSSTVATLALSANQATEMYITNDPTCSDGGVWEAYSGSKSWVLSLDQSRNAIVYAKYRNPTMIESACVSDGILVQGPNLLTNGDFETGDTTAWTNTIAGKWVVDSSNVYAGGYSAHTSAVANSTTACLTQSIDLTAATEDQVVDFTWSYGTQAGGDYAEFMVDAVTKLSLSGLSSGWTSHSVLLSMGANRVLKWCYRKNVSGVANGDYVHLDEVRVSEPVLLPPAAVNAVGKNASVALTITPPAAAPSGYLVLRGTSAVNFTPVNGSSYNVGSLGPYEVIYKGTSLTPSDTGLINGMTYYYAVYSYGASDNYSLAATTSVMPWGAYTPSALTATKGNMQVALSWSVPAGGAQTGYLLVQNPSTDVTFTPVNGTSYAVGTVTGGTVVFKSSSLSYTKAGLTNNMKYYYKVWSYDASNKYSLSYALANATPDSCMGTTYSGYCFYLGSPGQSCNTVCSAQGAAYNPTGTAAVSCSTVASVFGQNSSSGEVPYTGQDYLCSTDGTTAYLYSGAGNTGNKTAAGQKPICACQ